MADYEVLAPGGHARLVSDVKSYADRAGGKGTTQLADGSVTRDKLADGVTDRIDAMRDRCDPLVGNHFFNELAESTMLTADDAYAAPPESVDVYGVSTQVQTTGKNLLNAPDITLSAAGYIFNGTASIPAGTYTLSFSGPVNSASFAIVDSDGNIMVSGSHVVPYTFTLPDAAVSARFYVASAGMYKNIQIESGSTATSYEPYTGGKPAPNPEYPQEIQSVDDLTLHVCGKNLFDYPTQTWTNTNAYRYNSNTFAGGYRSIPEGVTTITASMYIDNSAAADTSSLNTWAHKSDGTVVAIGGSTVVAAGSKARVSKTYDVSEYVDFGLGASLAPNASASQLMAEQGSTATAYAPYVGQSVQVLDQPLRSLPDGTEDSLTLSYIGPSEREGWGVFGAELVQRIGSIDMGQREWTRYTNKTNPYFRCYLTGSKTYNSNDGMPANKTRIEIGYTWGAGTTIFNGAQNDQRYNVGTWELGSNNHYLSVVDKQYTTVADFVAAVDGMEFCYLLAEPITHDLGTVELPVNPAPDLTAWADGGSAQPTLSMVYEQDINIVIARLEAAIADLATA